MKPKDIKNEDILKLENIFNSKSLMITDAITKSMEIISEMTNYTSIVLGSTSIENKINKIEVVPLDDQKLIAIVITDKGHVEHKHIKLEEKVSVTEIKQTVDLINKLIVGVPINEVSTLLEYEIKPIISQYVKQHEVLYNAFYNAFTDFNDRNFKMNGTRNILMQPEFNNADKIRDDLNHLQNIKEEDNGINIYIGSENDFDDDLTIIKTKYKINGEEGTIALIGPKRMEYDRAITLLNYLKQNIDKN